MARGDHVAGRKLHPLWIVPLHEALALAFRRSPPSPRNRFGDEEAHDAGGQTIPVGWNWKNSMSISSAPASSAKAWPSPVYSQEFDVIL